MLGRGVPAESVDGQRLHSFFCRALLHPCDGSMVFGGRLGGRVLDIYIYILNFYLLIGCAGSLLLRMGFL